MQAKDGAWASPCVICGGQNDIERVFILVLQSSPVNNYSTNIPYLYFFYLTLMLYNLSN